MKSLESFILFSRATSSCIIVLLNCLLTLNCNPDFVTLWERGLFLVLSSEGSFSFSSFCSVQSDQKQVVLEKGEKERTEKRKITTEEEEEEKRKKNGVGGTEDKEQGGVSSDSVYFKSLDFPWNLSV